MKKTAWYTRSGFLAFWLTVVVFVAFFLYMNSAEGLSVYERGLKHHYVVLADIQPELVEDEHTPVGLRKVYRWTLEAERSWEDCLFIYFSHHNIEVYFDDVLEYGLTVADTNRIGSNVGSNWCSVHMGQNPVGTEITVIMTPLFEAAVGKDPTFYFGAHYAIAMDLLRSELLLMVFSALCFFVGLVLVTVSVYLHYVMNNSSNNMMFLGLFSTFLGLWRLTDLASMPMLFPDKSLGISYVSIGALFLAGLCLMMYLSTLFTEKGRWPMMVMVLLGAMLCIVVMAHQICGLAELRQNLIYCHAILVMALVSIPLNCAFNWMVYRKSCLVHDKRLLMLLLLLFGGILDMAIFYRDNNNSLLSFTISGFIIYTLIVFTGSVQNATRKAYTDECTGLVNRARWNELMHTDTAMVEPYGFLMIDLNGLKRANDTLGHEAGDQMIFRLSSILRNTLPRSSVICRWGGDEFAILLVGVDREILDRYIGELVAAKEKYNADHPELPIHFSLGAALSMEHPGISRDDLFKLADEAMYQHKQMWYASQK